MTAGHSQRNLQFLYGNWMSNYLVKCITCRQYVHSKEYHVKKTDFGQDLLNTNLNVSVYLCNAFLQFRVRRRNITHRLSVTVDFNLARFKVTDCYRPKTRFTSSLKHRTQVTCGASNIPVHSIQHSSQRASKS